MPSILILSWEYPPLIEGGLARHVRKLAEALVELDLDVHVLTRGGEESPPEEVAAGVRIHRVREPKRPTDLGALADADLVVEAVTEVLDVKRAVFAELEGLVRPDCVLATNTSALSVTAMADGLAHPERVVGLHFFNPVAQMPLVEVVATDAADATAVATGVDVARRVGKTVVRTTDRPGFVVNRVLLRMLADVLGAAMENLRRAFNPRNNLSPDKLLPTAGGCGMEAARAHPGRRASL